MLEQDSEYYCMGNGDGNFKKFPGTSGNRKGYIVVIIMMS